MKEFSGYRIWRKDRFGWELAFDQVFTSKESVDERILELNAQYHDLIRYGELAFLPYREDIRLSKSGGIIDSVPKKPVERTQTPSRKVLKHRKVGDIIREVQNRR